MTCMSASTKASKFGLHVSFQSLWSSLGLSRTILIDLAVYVLRMSHVLFPTLRNTYLYVIYVPVCQGVSTRFQYFPDFK